LKVSGALEVDGKNGAKPSPTPRPPRADLKQAQQTPPYTALAPLYDAAMGEVVLPTLMENFETSRRRFGLATEVMADIGCGTGRFLRYLTRYGGRLYGVDRSPAMLRIAARNLRGKQVRLFRMDLRRLRLPETVDTLTCMFDTINYLRDPGELRVAFAAFAAALKPEGGLMFDFIPNGAPSAGPLRGLQRVVLGRFASDWRLVIDPTGRGSRVEIVITKVAEYDHPRYYRETHEQTWFAESEVISALRESAFEVLEIRPAEPGGRGRWMHCSARLDKKPAS
jgi:SAM-dependent methyltransferase